MAPEEAGNGWQEHRALVEWRLARSEEALKRLEAGVASIQTTLAEVQGGRNTKRTILNLAVPAVVALFVVLLEQAAVWALR